MSRRMSANSAAQVAVVLISSLLAVGCATHGQRMGEARNAFHAGDLTVAEQRLEELDGWRTRSRQCVQLDRALVALAQGRPAEAESMLRTVRDRWEAADDATISEEALELVTDDTTTAYLGEDYERVLLRAMLAISNLMHDGSDAAAYCEQFQREQSRILTASSESPNGESDASRVALGAYLRGTLMEATHRDYDAAQRAFATVAAWQPGFEPAAADVRRTGSGVHSAPGHGVVYIWTLINRGPRKVEVTAEATGAALLLADQMISKAGDHTLPPTIAPVKIPMVVVPPASLDRVAVFVDGQPVGNTQTVTDVAGLAVARARAHRDRRLAEAIARRVVKKATVYTAKDALSFTGGLGNFALDAAGVLWEATERADTRCWSLLPGQVQVLRVELPAGEHQFSLQPRRGHQPLSAADSIVVDVVDGGNSHVLGNYPQGRLVGELLQRQDDDRFAS